MKNSRFYAEQYSRLISEIDKALSFLGSGNGEAAKLLLQTTLLAAEEAYILDSEEDVPL